MALQTFNPYTAEPITAVVAENRVSAYFKAEGENAEMNYAIGDKVVPYRVVARYKGAELVGLRYVQLMPWVRPSEKVADTSQTLYANMRKSTPIVSSLWDKIALWKWLMRPSA